MKCSFQKPLTPSANILCQVLTRVSSLGVICDHVLKNLLMPLLRMPWLSPMADWRNMLAPSHRSMSRCFRVGMTPFFSPMTIPHSIARDIVSTVRSARRFDVSMARVRAEMKPATGALTLSSRHPSRRIIQRTSLYAVLKHIRKRPNWVQSRSVLTFRRLFRSLAGLATSRMFLRSIWMKNPIKKFLKAWRTIFSKHPYSCLQISVFAKKVYGSIC